ncbi:unnamed protein product [Pedinophyceae sp. YPF-701]|nr:unnamed protein product [Pedinophyceae sp. YPF-701]
MGRDKDNDPDWLMKQGQKYISPSIAQLRLKPDWEGAAQSFEQAAALYKRRSEWAKAREAFEKAATAQEKAGSNWHAGRDFEAAASMAAQAGLMDDVAVLSREAFEQLQLADRATAAAQALSKGAKFLEGSAGDVAARMWQEAVSTAMEDGKDHLSLDLYREAVGSCLRAQRPREAADLLMKYALACSRTGASNQQCKAYLAGVVVLLHSGDVAEAWQMYQNAMTVDDFARSDEAFAADDLFQAYASGDAGRIKGVVKDKMCFQYIETAAARLARQLPQGDLPSMAAFAANALGVPGSGLGAGGMGDLEEDDLT